MPDERSNSMPSSLRKLAGKSHWHGRIPLTATLATAIGFLVLITAGLVFSVGAWLAQKNTFALLSANAHQAITADVSQIELHLQPAEHQARFLASKIIDRKVDVDKREQFGILLTGSLAAVPQIEAVVYVDSNFQSFGAARVSGGFDIELSSQDLSDDQQVRQRLKLLEDGPTWLAPIWRENSQKTYLSRAHPVKQEGRLAGAIIVVVSVERLSRFISARGLESTGNRFVLYGYDHVLAHWLLVDDYSARTVEEPLPSVARFGDPVLASIWQNEDRRDLLFQLPEGTSGHRLSAFNEVYAFVYQEYLGFGPEPLIVGTYFQSSDFYTELKRLAVALIAGLVALLLSLLAAIALGHRIAQPIVRFSHAASRVRDLEVSRVEELPGSLLRELNDQSVAFNAMLKGLRWFEMYVPKKVVDHLIRHGHVPDQISNARVITVMFTDMTGFSAVSEGMLASEVAAFVNHHFSLVVSCIEENNGVVDKYMGDAVMAFWDDISDAENGAGRACQAAIDIANAINDDNLLRLASGQPAVGIRIGIHTGTATVGNIGAPGRLNYTIIGDSVNVGQRLEQLGKEIYPRDTETAILISGDTRSHLISQFQTVSAGKYKLKGRVSELEVFKLLHNR